MSSAAQVLANRQNATRSTGPITPEGKAASSKNATRHGLTGAFAVLPHENTQDFDQLAAGIRDEFQPETDSESFLVDQMIHSRWRLARIQRLEFEEFNRILDTGTPESDPDQRIVDAMSNKSAA